MAIPRCSLYRDPAHYRPRRLGANRYRKKSSTAIAGYPLRLAFDAIGDPCHATVDASCLPSFRPRFRVQVDGGAFTPLELEQLGTERRFQGSVLTYVDGQPRNYLFLVDALHEQPFGRWVATVVVRRGLEL